MANIFFPLKTFNIQLTEKEKEEIEDIVHVHEKEDVQDLETEIFDEKGNNFNLFFNYPEYYIQ